MKRYASQGPYHVGAKHSAQLSAPAAPVTAPQAHTHAHATAHDYSHNLDFAGEDAQKSFVALLKFTELVSGGAGLELGSSQHLLATSVSK